MPDDNLPRFAPLTDGNYAEWSMRMEAELVRKGLWTDIVRIYTSASDPEEAEKEHAKKLAARKELKMAEARAEIIARVDDGQLAHMRSRDLREIWTALAEVHRARGFSAILTLRRSFLTGRKKLDERLAAYIGRVRSIAFKLEDAGFEVPEIDIIVAICLGLPKSYDPVIVGFDALAVSDLSLDVVIARLLNEETRHDIPGQSSSFKKLDPDSDNALASRTHGTISREDVLCWFCNKKGHFRNECRDRERWEEWQKSQSSVPATTNLAVVVPNDPLAF